MNPLIQRAEREADSDQRLRDPRGRDSEVFVKSRHVSLMKNLYLQAFIFFSYR